MNTQSLVNALLSHEQEIGLVDKKSLARVVAESGTKEKPLDLVIFSCLATKPGAEELRVDFFQTLFFASGHVPARSKGFCDGHLSSGHDNGSPGRLGHRPKRVIAIDKRLDELLYYTRVHVFLVNTEPRRTWGWSVEQEFLTFDCEMMVEQAQDSGLLPGNWDVTPWSVFEGLYSGEHSFAGCLEWAKGQGKHALQVTQQEACLRRYADTYHFPLGIRETAVRQVAAYAWEGIVLEQVYPDAILLQSEGPWKEKDPLYQLRRNKKTPLCIIHPFRE